MGKNNPNNQMYEFATKHYNINIYFIWTKLINISKYEKTSSYNLIQNRT